MAGPLLLAGGAEFDGRMADADKAVIDRLNVERARVVILPTANQDHPALAAANIALRNSSSRPARGPRSC